MAQCPRFDSSRLWKVSSHEVWQKSHISKFVKNSTCHALHSCETWWEFSRAVQLIWTVTKCDVYHFQCSFFIFWNNLNVFILCFYNIFACIQFLHTKCNTEKKPCKPLNPSLLENLFKNSCVNKRLAIHFNPLPV